jgi:sugar phosphate permease
MEERAPLKTSERLPLRVPFFYGWVIVALTFLTTLNGAGNRAALSLLIHPLEQEFGWSRASIASAGAINLFLMGAAAPFLGWLVDRFGPRKIMFIALTLLIGGVATTTLVREPWQLILVWGVIVGLGVGGAGSVLGAAVATRWFIARRGLTIGILNSAHSTGYLIFLPILMSVVVYSGWRTSLLALAAISTGLLLLIWLWMSDDPSDIGLQPYGLGTKTKAEALRGPVRSVSSGSSGVSLLEAVKSPILWSLCGSFFICGGTSAGLIGTHLIPHAIDRGISQVTAATTVGVMGGMNFVGTVLSGYLTDRMDPRKILAFVYALRATALFILPYVDNFQGLFIFALIYGLDWFASVPPTVSLAGEAFGRQSIGKMYGWIFFSHQLGAALSAAGAGYAFQYFGSYEPAFIFGGVVALVAAVMGLTVPHGNRRNETVGERAV